MVTARVAASATWSFYVKGEFNWNLSGNEVYHTNYSISLAKNMLRSKLHSQIFLIWLSFHIKLGRRRCAQASTSRRRSCRLTTSIRGCQAAKVSYERRMKLKLSGNEVYHTNSLIILVKIMLCRKRHCQKVLIWFPFYIKSVLALNGLYIHRECIARSLVDLGVVPRPRILKSETRTRNPNPESWSHRMY